MITLPTPVPALRPFCAPTIQQWFQTHEGHGARIASDGILHVRVATVGSHALVSWTSQNMGGMGLFAKRMGRWCVLSNGGGEFSADDMTGTDGITSQEAHRLFRKIDSGATSTFGIKP